jgi:hypothetical protein
LPGFPSLVDSHLIEKGDPNSIVNLCWDIWKQYGYMNTVFFIDGSNRAMVNLLKIRWQESLSWESNQSFGQNVRIRPVNFNTEHKNMLSNLHAVVSKGYLAIDKKYDKLITSLRTAYANELSLDKDQTSYSDLLDVIKAFIKGLQHKIESNSRNQNIFKKWPSLFCIQICLKKVKNGLTLTIQLLSNIRP